MTCARATPSISAKYALPSPNVTNVLNQYYMEKAWSKNITSAGVAANTLDNIVFFYNKGRQWNIRLKLQF